MLAPRHVARLRASRDASDSPGLGWFSNYNVEETAVAYVTRAYVAWKLGNEDWFATGVSDTAFKMSADKDGQLVYHHGATCFPLVNREGTHWSLGSDR